MRPQRCRKQTVEEHILQQEGTFCDDCTLPVIMLLEESKQTEVGEVVAVRGAVLGWHMGLVCTPEQVHRQPARFGVPAGGLYERVECGRVVRAGLPRM